MSPHNVLIVMHGAGSGGVEKALGILCKFLDSSHFRVVVALPAPGPLKSHLDAIGIPTIVTPLDSWTPIKFHYGERHLYHFLSSLNDRVAALVKIIEEHQIDLVHSATLSVADGAFAARVAGVPHLWHIHGKSVGTTDDYGSYLPIDTIYLLVRDLSDQVVPVSHDVARFLQRFLPGEGFPVIYNGIDLAELDRVAVAAQSPSVREEFGLQERKLVLLVGRVTAVKGIDVYLEAARQVLATRSDTAFLVVGRDEDADLAKRLKDQVQAWGLGGQIVFVGQRADVPRLLAQADLYVCSSRSEGFPYGILEAMAAALPVISTRCGGPEEMVVDGETGFLTAVDDSADIAVRLSTLLDNQALARQMGEKGRERVEREFSASVYARHFETLYQEISARPHDKPVSPWGGVLLELTATVGRLGERTRHLEKEVRDLRGFEALFKDNFIYRGVKRVLRR